MPRPNYPTYWITLSKRMELPLLSSSSKGTQRNAAVFFNRHTLEEDNYLFKPIPLMHPWAQKTRGFSRGAWKLPWFLFGELQGMFCWFKFAWEILDQISCDQLWYPISCSKSLQTFRSLGNAKRPTAMTPRFSKILPTVLWSIPRW